MTDYNIIVHTIKYSKNFVCLLQYINADAIIP